MPNLRSPYFWLLVGSPIALVWAQIVKPSTPVVIIVGIAAVSAYAAAIWFWLSKFQYLDVAKRQYHERGLKIFGVGLFVLAVILGFLLQRQAFLPTTNESQTTLGPPQQNNKAGAPQNEKSSEELRNEHIQRRLTQPYTIRKADREGFIETLRLSGKFSVDIECDVNSDLTRPFAEELTTLLKLSKWNVDGPHEVLVEGPGYRRGVIITINEKEEMPLGASLLYEALAKQDDIDVFLLATPPRKSAPDSFHIFIGPKP